MSKSFTKPVWGFQAVSSFSPSHQFDMTRNLEMQIESALESNDI
jgi:hypothetical protein